MRVLYLSFFLVIADQITKILVKGIKIPFLGIDINGMRYADSINVIGDFFKITFVENPGMAFGIDVGVEWKLLLSLFSLVASIGILVYLYKVRKDTLVLRLSLALIFAGAVGNLIDRTFYGVIYGYAPIFYGKVVDFFNVDFWDFTILGRTYDRWPIFNIADSAVTIGVLLLVIFHREIQPEDQIEEEKGNEVIDSIETSDNNDEIILEENVKSEQMDNDLKADTNNENGKTDNRKEI